ncbi:MAG: hypothetical protein M1834_001081 [Cirrosporium novae-zelandiae]|nr:MAG: hypothetical protein M1834_001081 [Cirrosporium novae-zelandiae]
MAILQIIVVLLRFYARKIKKVPYAIDDYLIVLALLGSLGQCVVYIIMVQLGGVGYHMSVVQKTPSKLVILEKTLFIDEILDFPFSVTPAKLSLIFFYVRIFDAFGEFRIWAAIVGFVVVGSGMGIAPKHCDRCCVDDPSLTLFVEYACINGSENWSIGDISPG